MLSLSVASNASAIMAELDDLTSGKQRVAIMRALNRAGDGVRTDASREIRRVYRVKKSTVDKAFSVGRASAERLQVVVTITGRPLSLAGFDPKQTRKGVTVNIKGQRKLIPHAFIRTLRTKKGEEYDVVFIRTGDGRFPVKALKTVDVPGAFTREDVLAVVNSATFERFDTELDRQMKYLLRIP